MSINQFFLSFVLVHGAACCGIFFLKRRNRIQAPTEVFFLAVVIPLWGMMVLWITHSAVKNGKAGSRALDLQRFEHQAEFLTRPFVKDEMEAKTLISLEEALLLEDPMLRRQLMKNLVQENPSDFIAVLRRSCLSEDTEVSHYASAALMQIQNDYEVSVQKEAANMLKMKTSDSQKAYITTLDQYIKSGLLPENAERIQRRHLDTALTDYLATGAFDYQYCVIAVDNALELGLFEKAFQWLVEAQETWPDDETLFLSKLKYYYLEQNVAALRAEISRAEATHVYLSPDTRSVIAFWLS